MRKERFKLRREDIDGTMFNLHEYGINPYSREIYLGGWEGNVEEEPGVDYRMAMTFIRNITFMSEQSGDEIVIHQCTVGGEWEYGMAIYDAIKNCPCHVTMICYAHSRSMSSITLQAADERVLMPNCFFMIHHGMVYMTDTYKGAESWMEFSKGDTDMMMEIYAERCSLTKKQILAKLDKKQEWYMRAEEAVELGFADKVFGVKA